MPRTRQTPDLKKTLALVRQAAAIAELLSENDPRAAREALRESLKAALSGLK